MAKSTQAVVAVLLGTGLYSGAVLAASLRVAHAGPSWDVIAIGAVGLLVSSLGFYAKGISTRVDKLENKMVELQTLVLRDYHSKGDLNDILGEIKAAIKALHQRFDKFEGLYGR